MKKFGKVILSLLFVVVCVVFIAPASKTEAVASCSNFYLNVSSSNYLEMRAIQYAPVYRDKNLTIRGNLSGIYNTACIDAGDLIYIYEIDKDSGYCKVNYPGSSYRYIGYCNVWDIFAQYYGGCSGYGFRSDRYVNVFSNPTLSGSAYGTIYKNDTVSVFGSYFYRNDSYFVVYDAKSGNRGYKGGWANIPYSWQ